MIKWFGPSHGAKPSEWGLEAIPTPVGSSCAWCGEEIARDDSGITMPHLDEHGVRELPYHVECHVRGIIGSVAHIERQCSCFIIGSECGDPPELTLREAAKEAVRRFHAQSSTMKFLA